MFFVLDVPVRNLCSSLTVCVPSGTHDQEPTTPILGLCHGIFTDRSIFRLPFPTKTKAVSVGDPMTSA